MDVFNTLSSQLAQISDLNAAATVLEWDQETYMPDGAAGARAHQIATLRKLAHEMFTSDEMGALLEEAEAGGTEFAPESFESSLLRVTRHDFNRATKLPPVLIADIARAVAEGKQAWRAARESDTFDLFSPHLSRIVDLNIQKAELVGFENHVYDALLDEYEQGMDTATVAKVFADLRKELVPIVQAIAEQAAPEDHFLHERFDTQKQWDFGMDILRDFGYDFNHGRQDISAHPFTTSFSITDVRLTTRVDEQYLPSALFGTLHECGHGLYEQGIDRKLDRTPLADGTSLGMHESQSRLWENLVGRSVAFWKHYYPKLQSYFPQLDSISLESFYAGINRVAPSLIRVEADEVTYNLHIMLRFELEQAMVSGSVSIEDLPELWNTMMVEYLGIRPDSNANGVLQDIHWSLGAIGYFPTYALGNLMSVQLFDQAEKELPSLTSDIADGQFTPLLDWLRTHIHTYGRARLANDLLEETTGSGLSAEPWLAYIRKKYGAIYGIL